MNLLILEKKLDNYIGMNKEDVEEFLYDELDDEIENVIDDEDNIIIFICNNFQITLNYYCNDFTNNYSLESYEIEIL